MDRKSARQRQESVEVEIIPPHQDHIPHTNTTVEKTPHHKASSKRKPTKAKTEQIQEQSGTTESWGIIDNSCDYPIPSASKQEQDDKKYCEFCGSLLDEQVGALLAQRRKYCSPRCRSIATGRRTRARLGVRPTRHEISKLNPLYFN
jgi:hypothetical protein